MFVVASNDGFWGRGPTLAAARRECAKAACPTIARLKKRHHISCEVTGDDTPYINQDGMLCTKAGATRTAWEHHK